MCVWMKTCLTALYIFPFASNEREREKKKEEEENGKYGTWRLCHVCMHVCMYAYKCDRVAIVS